MICECGARRLIKEVHNIDEDMCDKLIGLLINGSFVKLKDWIELK